MIVDPQSPTPSQAAQAAQAQAAQVAQAQAAQVAPVVNLPPKPLKVGVLKSYDGSREGLELFFSQLELYYGFNTAQFPTDQEKVLFAASYLEGLAFAWFNVYLRDYLDNQADPKKQEDNTRQVMGSLKTFKTAMRKMFGILDKEKDVERKLQALRQTGSVSEFVAKF